jgi:hypothetical protein
MQITRNGHHFLVKSPCASAKIRAANSAVCVILSPLVSRHEHQGEIMTGTNLRGCLRYKEGKL